MILTTGKDGILGMNNEHVSSNFHKELNVHKGIDIKGPLSYNFGPTKQIGNGEYFQFNRPEHWKVWLGYNEYIVMDSEKSAKALFTKIANYLD